MTREEFILGGSSAIRLALNALAGVLAARGMTLGGDIVVNLTPALAIAGASLFWSLAENSHALKGAIAGANLSDVETLASSVIQLRRNGADPLVVAHIAQAVSAVANSELAAARPDLVPPLQVPQPVAVPQPSPAASPPGPAVAPPPPEPVPPGPTEAATSSSADQPVRADGSLPA